MENDLNFLIVVFLLLVFPALATRNYLMPAIVISSFFAIMIPLNFGFSMGSAVSAAIFIGLFAIAFVLSIRKGLFRMEHEVELKVWRIIARPFALLFIPINIYAGHRFLLYLLGILSLIFISSDIYRLVSRRQLSLFYKKTEVQRFSSMTSFLVAIFIIFLLFPDQISYLCLGFIIFGDMAAKMTGLRFGRTRILLDRTLEGSLGFFTGCIYVGSVMSMLFGLPFSYLWIGALTATLAELFAFHVDDNFTVGILTGGCLQALHYFQVI